MAPPMAEPVARDRVGLVGAYRRFKLNVVSMRV